MAITATTLLDARVLQTLGSDGGNGNYTSSTFNVASGSTVVALMRYDFQGTVTSHFANIPTLVTAGLTWTLAKSVDPGTAFTACAAVYVADAASTLTGVSISQTATGGTNQLWNNEVSAVDATVVQLAGAAAAASVVGAFITDPEVVSGAARDPGTVSGTLSAAPASTSYVYDIMAMDSNPSSTGGSAGSGFTLLSSFAAGNPTPYLHSLVQYRTGSTSTTVAWTTTVTGANVYDYSRLAVEFKDAAGGGGGGGIAPAAQIIPPVRAVQRAASW